MLHHTMLDITMLRYELENKDLSEMRMSRILLSITLDRSNGGYDAQNEVAWTK